MTPDTRVPCPVCGGSCRDGNLYREECFACGDAGTVPESDVEEYLEWLELNRLPCLEDKPARVA